MWVGEWVCYLMLDGVEYVVVCLLVFFFDMVHCDDV